MIPRKVEVCDETDLSTGSAACHLSRNDHEVEFRFLGVPLTKCERASIGPVDPALVQTLRRYGFDQAPVAIGGEGIGWRLVTTDHLEALVAVAEPLTRDPMHFQGDDV